MLYLFICLMSMFGTLEDPKWVCDATTIHSVTYDSDNMDAAITSRALFDGARVDNVFATTSSKNHLSSTTHVVSKFIVRDEFIEKTFQLGTFKGIFSNRDDDDIEDYVWYDMEHGDYYKISYYNGEIIRFITHSTGNNTGLECLCNTKRK